MGDFMNSDTIEYVKNRVNNHYMNIVSQFREKIESIQV